MCKAYRTVSLNSVLLLAGILPLDLRIKEVTSLYEARRGIAPQILGDRDVERVTSALESPHPAECTELQITCLVDQEQVDASSDREVMIFTDGSKIGGRVGAALSIWTGGSETDLLKLALPGYCTVYQAELLAICAATRKIKKCTASTFGVYSDSMAALLTVKNPNCLHPLAVEAREQLRAASLQSKMVNLFWIKAHAGLEGNERADQLAKEAAMGSKKRPDYDLCPVSYIKRRIRLATLDVWNQRYISGSTASITKMFFPDAVSAYRIVRKLRESGSLCQILTQVMTGHGGFSEYLKRFKCKESSSCICDPDVPETVPHILLECPAHAVARYNLEQVLKSELKKESVGEIMAGREREIFIKYCIAIAEKVVKNNK